MNDLSTFRPSLPPSCRRPTDFPRGTAATRPGPGAPSVGSRGSGVRPGKYVNIVTGVQEAATFTCRRHLPMKDHVMYVVFVANALFG